MLKIGHRGAPGYFGVGENTISSFNRALWKGADAIEFDVRRSKDGHIVVIHDASVDRTTNGRGLVKDYTAMQLRALDAGFGDFIPKLSHVFEHFGNRCLLNIEIKELDIAKDILQLIREYDVCDRVIVSAFDNDDEDEGSSSCWDELGAFTSAIPIALVATLPKIVRLEERHKAGEKHKGFVDEAIRRKAFAIHPQFQAVNPLMVDYAHARGILIYAWTVNSISQAELAQRMKVDGVFSDCPEILR